MLHIDVLGFVLTCDILGERDTCFIIVVQSNAGNKLKDLDFIEETSKLDSLLNYVFKRNILDLCH